MDSTSLSLIDRLQSGHQGEDWTRFVQLYQPFIRRFIRMDAALSADADDICQEVLRKVVSHLPQFERVRDGSFRCWLKTITVNEVRYYWRSRLRRGNAYEAGEREPLEFLANPHDPLNQLWDREHGNYVLQKLQEIVEPEFNPTTWRAFRLRVIEQKSSQEVSQILNISRNAVDIAKSRVLSRLRKEAAGFLD